MTAARPGLSRARRIPHSLCCAFDVHTFCPLTTNSSPSRTARVCSDARSEPASGSLKSWHHSSSPRSIGARNRACWSSARVLHQRRRHHPERDGEHADGHAPLALLLAEDGLLDRLAAPAPERLRPRDARPPALEELALPPSAALDVLVRAHVAGEVAGREVLGRALGDGVGGQPLSSGRRGTRPPQECRRSPRQPG